MDRRRLGPWLVAALGVSIGATLGLGVFTLVEADALAYASDDPSACANCHIMHEQYEGWLRGPHKAVATCNDCHVPHDFVGKWLSKALNGFHHSKAFTLQDFHEPIRITRRNADALQAGCLHCHGEFVHEVVAASPRGDVECVQCHRSVGHDPSE